MVVEDKATIYVRADVDAFGPGGRSMLCGFARNIYFIYFLNQAIIHFRLRENKK